MEYVKISQVKVGTVLRTDGGFTCMKENELKVVQEDPKDHDLYISCDQGQHFLAGQIKDDYLIGLSKS